MKKSMTSLMLRLFGLASLAFASIGTVMAQPPASVGVYAEHRGGKVVYHYRVTNNSQDNIAAVRIGYDTKNDSNNSNNTWELLELPTGWDFYTGIPSTSATSPFGWRVFVITLEENEVFGINWETIDDNSPELYPSQTFTGMSVTLDKADINYITGHAFIIFSSKPKTPTAPTVPLERLDTTPPTLLVTLNPTTLWPPNNKMVSVTAAIAVNDDYDTEPEIMLESITASETLADGDIQDAGFAADDRQFSLAAEREGSNLAGRIYTVTYSATDASGNKATASATATVPHDQGK
ncbi:MAG: DUF5011 domain-containing protein [Gallionella sp.]|nr:DUF5011 domain-containing protein [Gallionella sp.]